MNPDWLNALYGGILVGISASLMLLWNGRVTGISGIIGGLIAPLANDRGWRLMFLLGLIGGGFAIKTISPEAFSGALPTSNWTVVLAGLLVGFRTVMGSGCTSGHGVCGISRFSLRSFVATIIFISSGILTVLILRKSGIIQ